METVELTIAGAAGPASERISVVVLGASNVSRGMARLAATVRGRSPLPVDLFVAAGHGRSYGVNSRVWMRRLPSILGSGLWRGLDRERITPARAGLQPGKLVGLLTDVGNDLLYGFSPEQVAGWVREAVGRLTDRGASLAIARLPLEAIRLVGPVRYRVLRTLLVPKCPLTLAGVHAATADLDGRLGEMATSLGLATIHQPAEWYGLDTLHPRRRRLDTLWHLVCDAWGMPPAVRPTAARVRDWSVLGSRAAEVRMLAGRMRFTPQPVHIFPDGSRVALY